MSQQGSKVMKMKKKNLGLGLELIQIQGLTEKKQRMKHQMAMMNENATENDDNVL